MKNKYENLINSQLYILLYTLILFFLVTFFIHLDLTHFYINPIKDKFNNPVVYGDWTYVLDSVICYKKGANLISNNYCDVSNRPYHYGSIFLSLPFVDKFYNFYYLFFPLVFCLSTIIFLNYYFKPKKIIDFLIIALLIFSTPIMMSFERINIEILIFLILILICYVRNLYIIQFLVLLATSIKFYPIVSSIIFLTKKKNITLFLNIFFFLILASAIFFIEYKHLTEIYKISNLVEPQTVDNVGMYLFSFKLLPELGRSTSLHLQFFNSYYCYIIINLILLTTFLYFILKINYFSSNEDNLINLDENEFEDRLFLISSFMLIVIYFMTMNYLYKEIYFLGLLPFLKKKLSLKNKYINLIYKLILIKFIILTFLWIFQVIFFSSSVYIKGLNILIKGVIDNLLIIFLIISLLNFFKKNKFLKFKLN